MEIAYIFFRFGRYSYDIADVLESMGSVAECDKSAVLEMATITREMVLLSVKSLQPEIEMLQDDSMNWMIKLMHYIENILMRLSLLQPIYKSKNKLQNHDVIFLRY
jgi:hypothetical protein